MYMADGARVILEEISQKKKTGKTISLKSRADVSE